MWEFFFAILTTLLLSMVNGLGQPHNCADIYKNDKFSTNGTYLLYNRQNQSFHVYCEFYHGYGYTYVDLTTTASINIADLYTDASHVLVRDLRTNGHQYVSRVEQMTSYKQYKLSVQLNSYTGYAQPQNYKMLPFLFVGFIPASVAKRLRAVQGYRVNGVDYHFVNCDANPNSYFVFLKNKQHLPVTHYNPMAGTLVNRWDVTAKPVPSTNYLPSSYFTFFEIHFGGCGGYATANSFPTVTGAALGLRYDITCPEPPAIANGSKSGGGTAVGSVVRYTCNIGYTLMKGEAVRTCLSTGQYTGQSPLCGQLPCDSKPCHNGGMCFDAGTTYVCECMEGFRGHNCDQVIGGKFRIGITFEWSARQTIQMKCQV